MESWPGGVVTTLPVPDSATFFVAPLVALLVNASVALRAPTADGWNDTPTWHVPTGTAPWQLLLEIVKSAALAPESATFEKVTDAVLTVAVTDCSELDPVLTVPNARDDQEKSNWPMAELYSWMKSVICLLNCSRYFSGCCKRKK
jgi:hypothetical protein